MRFVICGTASAATNIFLLYVLTDLAGIWYLTSSVLAFVIALLVSFTLQKFVTFKDGATNKLHHQFSKFFVAALLGVILNTAIVYVCVEYLGVWYIISQVIAGIFVMVQNFMLYRLFIFTKK